MPQILLFFKKDKSRILWILFGAAAIFITIRNMLLPDGGVTLTHYNNYVIFKSSFFHFMQNLDLYAPYPKEHYDLFKYSPSFALFMGLIAWMPNWLGLALWNLVNVFVLIFAINKLPSINPNKKLVFGLLAIQETVTAVMNSQSNVLIVGLLVLAWIALENNRWWHAAIFISLTVFIKIFGLIFFAIFLLYPKWWKGILPAFFSMLVLFAIPIPFIGFHKLLEQYQSYFHLLSGDHGTFVKYSAMAWLQSWFGFEGNKNLVAITGLLLQLIPIFILVFFTQIRQQYLNGLVAASLLISMVIFNHMAESATFIIAVTGVLIWFFYSKIPKWWRIALLIPVMLFTCFGPSDLYPPDLRQKIVIDWQLKVFPCILVWLVCMVEIYALILAQLRNKRVSTS